MASKNVETFRAAHQAFNRRDFDAVVSQMAEDLTYYDRARSVSFKGRNGFKDFMQGWVTAFSNAEILQPSYIDAGDAVIAEFTARGVNDGPLGTWPKTGRQMNLHFCEIRRFDDKGRGFWGSLYYDQLSLLTQLGHIQPPPEAAAR